VSTPSPRGFRVVDESYEYPWSTNHFGDFALKGVGLVEAKGQESFLSFLLRRRPSIVEGRLVLDSTSKLRLRVREKIQVTSFLFRRFIAKKLATRINRTI
jgi:hypothetical protein